MKETENIEEIQTEKPETKKAKAAKTPVEDDLEKLVPYFAIYDGERYKDDITVGLNGKIYMIKRGETVMIPKKIKLILDQQEQQDRKTARLMSDRASRPSVIETV